MTTHPIRHPSRQFKRPQPARTQPSQPLSKRAYSRRSNGASNAVHYKEIETDHDNGSMAVTFLNYCTFCEKQIIVPSSFMLYCSESRKKKDTEQSLVYPYDQCLPMLKPLRNSSFDNLAFRDIVPQRLPSHTGLKCSVYAFSDTSSDHNRGDRYQRFDREPSNRLCEFQLTSTYPPDTVRSYLPCCGHLLILSSSFSATTSLSYTPASSASCSLPHTTAPKRPFSLRTKSSHSSSYGTRSVNLVKPLTAPRICCLIRISW
ncbi:hypothetical protein COCSADRAFT_170294 [Bipolaris sorokiniana ND90Pr]|uniref:Uncharacterized protein n=1 Tax=Cochliobolus sativus (strain ND90Pr / ATCC 201652) TaxID=665912 RepID=M2TAB0_COCSN|nr:uncharacterized protein COCSADRAFT_170294 [Bipolaris sorokiniana ND90Pr]EMD65852.1 hypothetical protein COCSADRAFT_170294 [Bipolaris sorokiniana ND90Pr]